MKKIYEGKTENEVFEKCFNDLNINKNEIYYKLAEKETGLFKTKRYQLEVIEKKEIINYIKNYLKELTSYMNIQSQLEIRENDNIINIQLISENNSILIGKDGKTLSAIQNLIRQSVSKKFDINININLDISNYKNKKIKRIEYQVKKIANEVLKTKIDVELDPMNSYERRCIHCMISNFDNLATESIGEGFERHIIIKYVEK